MYIYADILLITNIYVDFLLINSAAALTRSPLKTFRGIAAAVIGSLFSLAIFIPRAMSFLLAPIKVISAFIIILAAFGFENMGAFLRRTAVFFLCAFIFGGLGTGLAYLTGGRFIYARNGVIYADFSFSALIVTSAAAYLCVRLYRRAEGSQAASAVYTVIVSDKGKTVSFKAVSDTGNLLKDSFTGKHVIICPKKILFELYGEIPEPDTNFSDKKAKWRFIPISTVSSKGLIAVISPSDICLKNDETGRISRADACLGAAETDCETGVFNPKLLI